jgi:hypothetical protein
VNGPPADGRVALCRSYRADRPGVLELKLCGCFRPITLRGRRRTRVDLRNRTLAVLACGFIAAVCSAQTPEGASDPENVAVTHTLDDLVASDHVSRRKPLVRSDTASLTTAGDSTDISSACVSRRVTAGSGQSQQRMARAESFEQLRVLVGPGDTISVREPLRPRRRDSFFRLAAASDASDGP